jgi:predicted MFS family arabinose efflux permease
MVGVGESYFAAFTLAKKFGEVSAGLIITLPLVIGSFLAIYLNSQLRRRQSYKSWVSLSVLLQACCFLPLILLSEMKSFPVELLFVAVSLYFALGFVAGPAWNYWMATLVPSDQASQFFAQRLRVSQMGQFLGLIIGGQLLHFQTEAFDFLFVLALCARLISWWNLKKQPELLIENNLPIHSVWSVLKKFFERNLFRHFFLFLFIFYVVIYISSPFVNPFFLAELKFSYEQFMFALLALLVGKILLLPLAPKLIERWGVKKIFFIGALGISPLPAVWAFAKSYEAALWLQTISGMFWALFEVGFSVIFFNHLKPQDKIAVLSIHNFFNSLAILFGSLIGAYLLMRFQTYTQGYNVIFVLGAGLRVVVVLFFIWFLRGESLKKLSM